MVVFPIEPSADMLDRAAVEADIALQTALHQHRKNNYVLPQFIDDDGRILCRDCELPIDGERLRFNPLAFRCVHCQRDYEMESRQFRSQ